MFTERGSRNTVGDGSTAINPSGIQEDHAGVLNGIGMKRLFFLFILLTLATAAEPFGEGMTLVEMLDRYGLPEARFSDRPRDSRWFSLRPFSQEGGEPSVGLPPLPCDQLPPVLGLAVIYQVEGTTWLVYLDQKERAVAVYRGYQPPEGR